MCLLLSGQLFGVLLYDMPVSFQQPDGSTIDIFASGDEFHNWLHDKDGYTIVREENSQWYVYAQRSGDSIVAGTLRVGLANPKSTALEPRLNLSQSEIAAKYERQKSLRDYSNGRSPHTGQFNNLVIFIRFSDDPPFMQGIDYYENMFNATGTTANSQKNYFWEASYQQLTVDSFFYPPPSGNTVVSYIDPQPRNYYRPQSLSNPIGYDVNDDEERALREQTMLANAVAYVESMIPTSLVVDGDGDGYVDNVCFNIQGQPDGWAELLWPHRWVMYYANAFIHGARVWDFNLQLESFLASSGASVLAHEMFHSLGAPDLYRYSDNTITPIGQWDLMAGNSNPPQHMSVWMKHRYGEWVDTVPTITTSGTYTLSPVATSSTNNIYRIPSWRNVESYVLEYRRGSGFYDDNLPGTGLLVYRLDTRQGGNADGPPDELYLYRPGGANTTTNGSLSQAHYSAQVGRTKITETTLPSGFTGTNMPGGLFLYDISVAGETITFSVKISNVQLTQPIGGETWFSGSNKEIKWKAKTTTGNVSIEYTFDNGTNWTTIAASTPNDGSFIWSNIPIVDTHQANIRITMLTGGHTDTCIIPFNIISQVNAPLPVYPENNATAVPTDPLITWDNVFGANSYQFQLSEDSEFESYVFNVISHPTNSFQVPYLQPFTTYYWRVATISDVGYSEFCPTQVFTTGEISVLPASVSLVAPTQNATNQPRNLTLQWSAANYAHSYSIQIALDNYFANGLLEYENIIGTSFQVPMLNANTIYYWRVRAQNPAGYGYFSPIRRFTTGETVGTDENVDVVFFDRLMQNNPNPFRNSTQIIFSIKEDSQVQLDVFNTRGQLIKTLASGTYPKGEYRRTWDGRDRSGKRMPHGIYIYRLSSKDYKSTRKMLLMD